MSLVAIVGRPNVGKSRLFNRIVGERLAIVDDKSGVTRDRLFAKSEWNGQSFELVDTGGLEISGEDLNLQIKEQTQLAIEEADLIVFVVNGRLGVTENDRYVAKNLHKTDKPVILAANFIDQPDQKDNIYDFLSLGFSDVYPISSSHGLGVADLLDKIIEELPNEASIEDNDQAIKFAIIGRPNVGKSSIVNAILGENRMVVADIPGVTRDSIDSRFITEDNDEFIVVDTAGINKRGRIIESTDKYSLLRAQQAISKAQIVLLVIDAEQGIIEQDKHVASYGFEEGRAIIVVVNKWDLLTKDNKTTEEWTKKIRNEFKFLDFAPIVFVSAKTGQRLNQLPELIKQVNANFNQRVSSSTLNDVINKSLSIKPPPTLKGRKLRVYYVTQVSTAPPTFVVFVNNHELMHFSYQRFLENQIRSNFDFEGTPIKLVIRNRN